MGVENQLWESHTHTHTGWRELPCNMLGDDHLQYAGRPSRLLIMFIYLVFVLCGFTLLLNVLLFFLRLRYNSWTL